MTVLKMERSDSTKCLLITDSQWGPTIFVVFSHETDAFLVKDYMNDNFGVYSRSRTYEEYKSDATDWRTIYEKGE